MLIQAILFYVFAGVMFAAALGVVFSRNPVHSVMLLVLTFFNAAILWLMAEAEFLAIVLVLVYVGAVMVLFLFVVMMLDIDFIRLREGFMRYLPVGAMIGLVLLAELAVVIGGHFLAPEFGGPAGAMPGPAVGDITNTEAIGRLIYTDYVYIFQTAGLVLLVAMVGAIVLTARRREGVKRQRAADQSARRPEDSVEIVKSPTGSGV